MEVGFSAPTHFVCPEGQVIGSAESLANKLERQLLLFWGSFTPGKIADCKDFVLLEIYRLPSAPSRIYQAAD